MYSFKVSAILAAMVVTGAIRSVAVQLFFQMGFEQPLFVTLLYLLGQSLALLVYLVQKKMDLIVEDLENKERVQRQGGDVYIDMGKIEILDIGKTQELSRTPSTSSGGSSGDEEEPTNPIITEPNIDTSANKTVPLKSSAGSVTGLNENSRQAIAWIHRIPYYAKPLVPGFFNLCNSAMRWTSLLYVKASVAEMLISGLELILSVVAARLIRKRLISSARMKGVGLVAIGVVLVGAVNTLESARSAAGADDDKNGGADSSGDMDDKLLGNALIFGQCVMSVLQDLAEELFMQEAQFPSTLLLGMEGLFGLAFGILLYNPFAHFMGEDDLVESWDELAGTPSLGWYACGLTLLVTITGMFNILATRVTSSMTRNVWKNLRTALVWVFALGVFYLSPNGNDLGEEWIVPHSYYILGCFSVIVGGIYTYYTSK